MGQEANDGTGQRAPDRANDLEGLRLLLLSGMRLRDMRLLRDVREGHDVRQLLLVL